MMIEVTQEDIDEGIIGSPRRCPVARAITRKLGSPAHVGIEVWWKEDTEVFHPLSKRLYKFVSDIDLKRPVKPSRFRL